MRAVPRMASVRTASLKGQVVVSSKVKVSSKLPALASMRGISCAQPGVRNDFETRWIDYFERADLSVWELRQGLGQLAAMDLVPEPQLVEAAIRACARADPSGGLASQLVSMVRTKSEAVGPQYWAAMQQYLADRGIKA